MSQSSDTGVMKHLGSKILLHQCLSPPLSKPLRSEVLCTKLENRSESELACSTVGLSHPLSSASRNAVHIYSFNVPEDELKSAHDILDKEEERRAMRLVANT